jgi:hypothetical protein
MTGRRGGQDTLRSILAARVGPEWVASILAILVLATFLIAVRTG